MRTNDEIIEMIKNLCIEKDISLSELARRVGMAKSAISRYFNGTRQFPLNRIDDFAKALNITPEYLLDVIPIMNNSTTINQTNTSDTSDERTKRLRKAVENSGYSQTQLCEITGINKGALSSYLSGRYYPKQQAIEKLSEALNVPIFWLMGYDAETDTESQEEGSYYIDKEAKELAQFLFKNPEYKILFDAAKDVSADDLEMVKTIIDKFKK